MVHLYMYLYKYLLTDKFRVRVQYLIIFTYKDKTVYFKFFYFFCMVLNSFGLGWAGMLVNHLWFAVLPICRLGDASQPTSPTSCGFCW
jgi:hypothetical protein